MVTNAAYGKLEGFAPEGDSTHFQSPVCAFINPYGASTRLREARMNYVRPGKYSDRVGSMEDYCDEQLDVGTSGEDRRVDGERDGYRGRRRCPRQRCERHFQMLICKVCYEKLCVLWAPSVRAAWNNQSHRKKCIGKSRVKRLCHAVASAVSGVAFECGCIRFGDLVILDRAMVFGSV